MALTQATAARDHAGARAVVLVEGRSDEAAVLALARRHGRDLLADGVHVVVMGGATSIGHFLDVFGPRGLDVTIAGLCDAGEERIVRRSLERSGVGSAPTREAMERLGFLVCVDDLEDELIRALGTDAVERVLDAEGDLASFRTFQRQPAQRDRPPDRQLRRFMGTRSGRKVHYADALVRALDLAAVPRPLDALLARV